jgi:hypothetical protein
VLAPTARHGRHRDSAAGGWRVPARHQRRRSGGHGPATALIPNVGDSL